MSIKYSKTSSISDSDVVRTFPYSGNYTYSGEALGGHQGHAFFQDEVYIILNSVAKAPESFEEIKITMKGAAWERSFTYHPSQSQRAMDGMHKYCATKKQ